MLVLYGSVSSWIEKNILNNTGFAGRISYDLKLEELNLKSCNIFWGKNHKLISSTKKLKMLSVMGGFPLYEEIRPELPAEEIIHQLCFKKEGFLFSEFYHIFNSIFDRRAPFYKKILQSLVYGSHDLEQAGFISKDSAFNLSTGKISRFAK